MYQVRGAVPVTESNARGIDRSRPDLHPSCLVKRPLTPPAVRGIGLDVSALVLPVLGTEACAVSTRIQTTIGGDGLLLAAEHFNLLTWTATGLLPRVRASVDRDVSTLADAATQKPGAVSVTAGSDTGGHALSGASLQLACLQPDQRLVPGNATMSVTASPNPAALPIHALVFRFRFAVSLYEAA